MKEDFDGRAKGHTFPKAILEMINENSGGGFMLFYISERGYPCFYLASDSVLYRRGLADYANSVVARLRELGEEELDASFIEAMDFDFIDDEEEDGESF